MAARRFNYRLAKRHRSYTVAEVADLYAVHRNTVREWIKRGLPTVADRRPLLILGRDLGAFLRTQRAERQRRCQPGEIYCVGCRAPRVPAGAMAEYEPSTPTLGTLVGICPSCDSLMYRRVNPARLVEVRGNLDITMPKAPSHISESAQPSVNSDFEHEASEDGKAQPH